MAYQHRLMLFGPTERQMWQSVPAQRARRKQKQSISLSSLLFSFAKFRLFHASLSFLHTFIAKGIFCFGLFQLQCHYTCKSMRSSDRYLDGYIWLSLSAWRLFNEAFIILGGQAPFTIEIIPVRNVFGAPKLEAVEMNLSTLYLDWRNCLFAKVTRR